MFRLTPPVCSTIDSCSRLSKVVLFCLAFVLPLGGAFWLQASQRADSTSSLKNYSISTLTDKTALPNLRGDEAVEYLKQEGLYPSLEEAIAAARYKVYRDEQSNADYYTDNSALRMSMKFDDRAMRLIVKQPLALSNDKHASDKAASARIRPDRPRYRESEARLRFVGAGYGKRILPATGNPVITADGNRFSYQHQLSGQASVVSGQRSVVADYQVIDKSDNRQQTTDNGQITEWYINRADGIEHGFTLNSPPTEREGDEPLRVEMEFGGEFSLKANADGKGLILTGREGLKVSYDKLKVIDATGKELDSEMKVQGRRVSIEVADIEAEYPVTIDPVFEQVKKLTASDGVGRDGFGVSVSISGGTTLISTPFDDNSKGSAYVFASDCNYWVERDKQAASDGMGFDGFGLSVSISGDTIVVGANRDNLDIGAAYIFERNEGGADNWGQVKKLTASDGVVHDRFGWSVSINGDTIIVGAPSFDDSDKGSAYVFERNEGGADNWGQVKKLTASGGEEDDEFGLSVSISGDIILVGAAEDNSDKGAAYIFERNQGGADNWGEVKKLTASDGDTFDGFGGSVSISGDTVIVGASSEDTVSIQGGAAYIFERNEGGADNWGEVKKLAPSGGSEAGFFGQSVSISGDTIVIGAYANASDRGAAYVFDRNQGGADNWGQVKKLIASDGTADDVFGWSVSINGDTIVIGADILGFTSSSNPKQGMVYIYKRNEGGADNWGEVTKLIASDGEEGDQFGFSVSISGDTLLIGAKGDDDQRGSSYILTTNCPPVIATNPVSLNQTTTTVGTTIASVRDDITPASELSIAVESSPRGITISNIVNTSGVITANVAASCSASPGFNTITLSVIDEHGLVTMANLIVNVLAETVPPVITCPANITTSNDAGQCSAVVNFNATANDNCGGMLTPVCSPASGSTFAAGTTTVNCTISDAGGNRAQCSFTVTVNDTESPVIACPANITASNQAGQCSALVNFNTTANDNCDGELAPICTPATGTTFPLGTITVNCSAQDSAGNMSSCSFTVTVNDTQPPAINCPSPVIRNNDPGICGAVVSFSVTATDNCSGVSGVVCTPPSGSTFPAGTTTVNCSAQDSAGNMSNCSFTVTVNDSQSPMIACPENIITVGSPGSATVIVNYPAPMASDNCAVQSPVCIPPSGSAFPIGVMTVTCTATDAAGNQSSCSFNVTTFDVCVQDDSYSSRVLLWNSQTGDYLLCYNGTSLSGQGTITKQGNLFKLTHYASGRRLTAQIDKGTHRGTASLQMPVGQMLFSMTDRDTRNNSCSCEVP